MLKWYPNLELKSEMWLKSKKSLYLIPLLDFIILIFIPFITFRLNYPSKMTKIYDLKGESSINSAVDLAPNAKAIFYQFAMIPKDSSKASSVTFDMEYKAAASKATLLIVN